MKYRLLITGGCGFIGTNLIRIITCHDELRERFESIIVYDNLSTGHYMSTIHDDPLVKFINGDIRNSEFITYIFNIHKPNIVLHLAGLVSIYDCDKDPKHAFDVNLLGSINVVDLCTKNNIPLICAETSAVYEGSGEPPYKETQSNPITVYAQTKAALANYIKYANKIHGLKYYLLRFFNVAGVFQDYRRTVPALHCGFVARILQDNPVIIFGDGNRRRDFIHVYDVLRFILEKCIFDDINQFANRTYNLGTGKSTSLLEIRKLIYERLNSQKITHEEKDPIYLPEINGEAFDIYADISRALSTGWKPQCTMEMIIDDTIDYIENEIRKENIPANFMGDIDAKFHKIKIG